MRLFNQKGFALALVLAFIPVVISGLILVSTQATVIQADLSLKYQCRTLGRLGQSQVLPILKTLLSLNPKAQHLRDEQAKNRSDIASATITKNPVALAIATKKYLATQQKQIALSIHQKQLLRQGNFVMSMNHRSTATQIRHTAQKNSSPLIEFHLLSVTGPSPRFAVQPDDPDVAPLYNPVFDFKQAQALAHQWHYRLKLRAPFSKFLSGSMEFKRGCAVTLKKENNQWMPQISEAKYSLKSFW